MEEESRTRARSAEFESVNTGPKIFHRGLRPQQETRHIDTEGTEHQSEDTERHALLCDLWFDLGELCDPIIAGNVGQDLGPCRKNRDDLRSDFPARTKVRLYMNRNHGAKGMKNAA